MNKKIKFAPFDASKFLDSEEAIAEYLSAAAEQENPAVLLAARADVARARGIIVSAPIRDEAHYAQMLSLAEQLTEHAARGGMEAVPGLLDLVADSIREYEDRVHPWDGGG